jgi:DNA modification methylase
MLIFDDCTNYLPQISDSSVALVLCDLPYGTTALSWDRAKYKTGVIDFPWFWVQMRRVLIPTGVVVMFSKQPYTSLLVSSKPTWFRQELIWHKNRATGHMNCGKRFLDCHENILVFAPGQESCTYNPQKIPGKPYIEKRSGKRAKVGRHIAGDIEEIPPTRITNNDGWRYPQSILDYPVDNHNKSLHPTQKPLALCELLVQTYSNPGGLVLDPTCGSGTALVAAIKHQRQWLGIENNFGYFKIAEQRIELAGKGEYDFRRMFL